MRGFRCYGRFHDRHLGPSLAMIAPMTVVLHHNYDHYYHIIIFLMIMATNRRRGLPGVLESCCSFRHYRAVGDNWDRRDND